MRETSQLFTRVSRREQQGCVGGRGATLGEGTRSLKPFAYLREPFLLALSGSQSVDGGALVVVLVGIGVPPPDSFQQVEQHTGM